jgi:hypothetical protein
MVAVHMSIPDKARKYSDKAIIEPARVIEERKKIGLHPSCPVPAGAIMCYDTALWDWVCAAPGYVECDGWLEGAYLAPCKDSWVLVLKVPGFGASTAVMTLEELAAFRISIPYQEIRKSRLSRRLTAGYECWRYRAL